jgi:glutathione S-transferase
MSRIGFFASSVHPAHSHIGRPERYASDKAAQEDVRATSLKTFHGYLKDIDGFYAGKEWMLGAYSVVDPYALVFYAWGLRRELPVAELKNYTAFKDRMLKRPAVQRVVEDEKIKL